MLDGEMILLPPALEEFSGQPFWGVLFLILAIGVTLYSGLSLLRRRRRQDLYYLLLGLYLTLVQLPSVFPSVAEAVGLQQPLDSLAPRLLLAAPAIALFVLGVRARGDG